MGDTMWPSVKLLVLVVSTTFLSLFPDGFLVGVTGLTSFLIKAFINESLLRRQETEQHNDLEIRIIWGSIVATPYLSIAVGALLAPYFADNFGRRYILFIHNNLLNIIGGICAFGAKYWMSWELLICSRFLAGTAAGAAILVVPIYCTECSPIGCRGMMGCMVGPAIFTGSLVSQVLSIPSLFGTENRWHLLYGLGLIFPAVIQIALRFIVPETPQYDYLHNNNRERSRNTVVKYFGKSYIRNPEMIDGVFAGYENQRLVGSEHISIRKGLMLKKLYPTLVLAVTLCLFRAASGFYLLTMYTDGVLEDLLVPMRYFISIGISLRIIALLISITSCFLVEITGRRRTLLAAAICFITAWLIIIMVDSVNYFTNIKKFRMWMSTIALCTISLLQALAGPITYAVAAELCSQSHRAVVSSISLVIGSVAFSASLFLYPIMLAWSSIFTKLSLYFIPLLLCYGIFWFLLPETKNRPIEDIVIEIRERAGLKSDDLRELLREYKIDDSPDCQLTQRNREAHTYGAISCD